MVKAEVMQLREGNWFRDSLGRGFSYGGVPYSVVFSILCVHACERACVHACMHARIACLFVCL